MKIANRLSRYALCAVAAGALSSVVAAATPAQLRYSPDSAVDANPTLAYVEPAIGADSADAKTLVAGAMSIMLLSTDAWVSHDGGYDWTQVALPAGRGAPIGDVQVASAPDGDIYFTELGWQRDASGKNAFGIFVFASRDRGDTFERRLFIRHSFDHEQLTIDNSQSRFRGRIYMSVLDEVERKPPLHACSLLSSSDGGRHFSAPVPAITGWCFNSRPVILSNGTVVFPFYLEGPAGERGLPKRVPNPPIAKVEVAISRDGGKTFAARRAVGTDYETSIADRIAWTSTGHTDFDGDPVPQFAAGISPITHRDVIYGAWSDMRTNVSRLLFTMSTDGGEHWTAPRAILTTGDPRDAQYQVALAVNRLGILAISYLQYSHARGTVNEMFADSADAGTTFSQPVRIDSTPSRLGLAVNSGYGTTTSHASNQIFVGFVQSERRYPSGGDYVGMAADRNGTFHPIWADARTGAYQVWTAGVSVDAPERIRPRTVAANVSNDVDAQFGLGTWDAATRTLAVPVRLHNAGSRPLYPPFTAVVTKLSNPFFPSYYPTGPTPWFSNARNGLHGVGATFVYGPRTLGNLGILAPGADSASQIWKIHLPAKNEGPSIMVRVDGYEAANP
jgi:hypothetical protein